MPRHFWHLLLICQLLSWAMGLPMPTIPSNWDTMRRTECRWTLLLGRTPLPLHPLHSTVPVPLHCKQCARPRCSLKEDAFTRSTPTSRERVSIAPLPLGGGLGGGAVVASCGSSAVFWA